MKTIGYVLANFPVLSETFVLTEMRAMMRRGHRVVPIVMTRLDAPRQPDSGDIAAMALYLDQVPAGAVAGLLPRAGRGLRAALRFVRAQQGLPRRSLLWSSARIAAAARARGCTHLHAHFAQAGTAHAIVAARLMGAGVSFVCHGHDVYQHPIDLAPKLLGADAALAVCEDMRADLVALAPAAPIFNAPCGVDAERFRPRPEVTPNHRLLFVGRLIDCKGVDDLLWALAQLPAERRPGLDIVGDGGLKPELTAMAAELGLGDRVDFLGARSSEWIAEQGPAYMAFVGPFRPAADGLKDTGPLVVKEAMAMGLPVIATRQMGLKETVDAASGFLAEPGDRPSLLAMLERFLALDQARRAAMGRGARARVLDRFTDVRQAETLSRLVEAI
ncbi:MAG: glycosyl transferase family 1 [Rhodospirillales bacterium]|nr:glycosyl transferase family 1 [Rhodospirillales bacterium]